MLRRRFNHNNRFAARRPSVLSRRAMVNRRVNINRKAASATVEFEVPGFWGFYESLYTDTDSYSIKDWYYSGDIDEETEELFDEFMGSEFDWALDDDKIAIFDNCVGEYYTANFDNMMKGIIPSWKGSTFVELESPQYYNHSTDRIFAKTNIDDAVAEEIKEYIESNKAAFDNYISDKFRVRDGFIPFYSDDPDKWMKSLKDMDHNELCAVFEFILDNEYDDFEGSLNEHTLEDLSNHGETYELLLIDQNQKALEKYMKENGGQLPE